MAERPGWVRAPTSSKPNLWEKQEEILEAVRVHTRVAVRSCNGSGKTFIAAHAVLWWLMSFPDSTRHHNRADGAPGPRRAVA